jgi:hypothetical protein
VGGAFEQKFVLENWHANLLRRVFEIAGFGIVGGRVHGYEINTIPIFREVTIRNGERH